MADFDVVLVAMDDYPDPPGALPSSASAAKFGELLGSGRGGHVRESVVVSTEQELVDAIRRWESERTRTASVFYVVGHGTGNGLVHELLVPAGSDTVSYRTARLAEALQREWEHRRRDPAGWTLVVLDCCDSRLGVVNVEAALAANAPIKPANVGLWPVAPGGGARTGDFVAAFERVLDEFTENDTAIRLDELFRRVRRILGDLEPAGFLPDEACLNPPTPDATVVMPLDVHAELRRAIEGQPPHVRSHFLAKAQGGEVGEVTWHFSGRGREVAELCDWLAGDGSLKVVTGEAGSGKSALLGHLAVLADPELVSLYADSGIAPQLATGPRPPDRVFRAVVHLTGKTVTEAVDEIASQLGISGAGGSGDDRARQFADAAAAQDVRGATVLVDALDESQDPERIAAFLHDLAERGVLRVLIGTRRSAGEGPDRPADPARRELLDALRVADADLLVVERDQAAVREYVTARLTRADSPYRALPNIARQVAARIAESDQPFLFARLATAELSARDPVMPSDPALTEMLGAGHRGLFAAALARIGGVSPAAFHLMHALAHARGRGMPRNAGIWVDAARAVGDDASEEAIPVVAEIAGPYVTLDGEAGQSTYRLAHQTFVEHFHARPGYAEGHRRIARVLIARHRRTGWATANFYAVRYLPEHLVADADRAAPDVAALAALVTDPGWLLRAVDLLGVDATVDVIAAAHRVTRDAGVPSPQVETVERALRRSRTALSRDPVQLAGQLHARLKDEDDPVLAGLGSGCGDRAGRPWLRMVAGRLDWLQDLEATYGLAGKLRGLAFGPVGDRSVVAIAIDHRIVLWDPRRGAPDEAGVIDLGDTRATAVAIGRVDDRSIVVTSAAYDGVTDVWDARSGAHVASAPVSLGHSVAVGTLGGRLVIAGVPSGGTVAMLDARTMEPIEPPAALAERDVRAFAVAARTLVALCVEEPTTAEHAMAITVADAETGGRRWRSMDIGTPNQWLDVVTGGDVGGLFVVIAGCGGSAYWLTKGFKRAEPHGQRLRAAAVGSVGGRHVVAFAPDEDSTALVGLHEIAGRSRFRDVELYHPRAAETGLWGDAEFRHVRLPDALAKRNWMDKATTFSVERPEEWPHTAAAEGELGGRPVLVTGSVEGAVWVWDTSAADPRALAGPFVTVSRRTLDNGWRAFGAKPGVPTADSVAYGHHAELGPLVAVACDGAVRLYTVPDGDPVESPTDSAAVIDAVGLGRIGERDVLVTGSKGGVLDVWGLTPPERIATLTLDSPIIHVDVSPVGTITAFAATNRAVVVEVADPVPSRSEAGATKADAADLP